jgi:hypothetical protein
MCDAVTRSRVKEHWLTRAPLSALSALLCLFVAGCSLTPLGLPDRPLFRGIKSWSHAESIVHHRLNARWPTGAPEEGLAEYLQDQHFEVTRRMVELPGRPIYGEAFVKEGDNLLCRGAIFVSWRADDAHRMIELSVQEQTIDCP